LGEIIIYLELVLRLLQSSSRLLKNSLEQSVVVRRKERNIITTAALGPHPNPLPKGEGVSSAAC
jgi:hypothetical protein